jgi:hypothetical protein
LNRTKAHLQEEKNDYIYRSYIGQGQYDLVIGEINDKACPSQQSIKLFAQYLAKTRTKESIIEQLESVLADGNKTAQVIAATIYLYENKTNDAFRVLKDGANLEQ